MHRYIVVGAGAIGALVGARLHVTGHDVVLVARGQQLSILQGRGLLVRSPTGEEIVRAPAVGQVSEVGFREGDTIILATKTQDSLPLIEDAARRAPPQTPVLCAQNGLESERLALRFFPQVYGGFVFVPSDGTEPGTVTCHAASGWGSIDVGRYPSGVDAHATRIAAHLQDAGFSSLARDDIMAWKRGKLVINTVNAVDAACGRGDDARDLIVAARGEAEACFAAAGLPVVSGAEIAARDTSGMKPVNGRPFPGSSTWQSLTRGLGATEADYLNGEVVLMGREIGFPTPVNTALQTIVREMALAGAAPGAFSPEDVRHRIEAMRRQ
jgi:2-dehydropantoate 2-reductase